MTITIDQIETHTRKHRNGTVEAIAELHLVSTFVQEKAYPPDYPGMEREAAGRLLCEIYDELRAPMLDLRDLAREVCEDGRTAEQIEAAWLAADALMGGGPTSRQVTDAKFRKNVKPGTTSHGLPDTQRGSRYDY